MKFKIDGKEYNVIIIKKRNKNTYVRIDESLSIIVTTNYLTPKYKINKILLDNIDKISKMISKKEKIDNNFYYLGQKYDIIIDNNINSTFIDDNVIYTKNETELNKWLKNQTKKIFKERLDLIYKSFNENIIYPDLKIRNMKSRWGVCNKKGYITLNSNLIKYNISEIDYVIVHELSHYVHFDHSKEFWNTVSKYFPDYKKSKKVLNG
ncbi:MAG: M48 family metallopeptidase [Firmicutes bacterium]|nr:M48 family metallopeptidase [Bacillota bacterium]